MQSRSAANLTFLLRMSPLACTLFLVTTFCVPSYLQLEPDHTQELVGIPCLLMALAGALICVRPVVKTAIEFARSRRLVLRWRQEMSPCHVDGIAHPVGMITNAERLVVLAGFLRHGIYVSKDVLDSLPQDQLRMALRHEIAHRSSHDNLKRLLLFALPDAFPFLVMDNWLDSLWGKLTEWAADDEATAGNQQDALTLAAALVHLVRLGSHETISAVLASPFSGGDLEERIQRLLELPASHESRLCHRGAPMVVWALVGLASAVARLSTRGQTMMVTHQWLERLLR